MMESLISEWDGESLVIRYDQPTGAWLFIAIHSTRLGPATGGIRVTNYPSPEAALQDALRLATAMTYKFAVPGISRGGGKAVISLPEDLSMESYHNLLRRFGKLLHQLGGLFYTGMDVGTTPEDMNIIAETGAPYVFCRTPAEGGAGSSGPITALGVFSGIEVACEHIFGEPSLVGRKVLVQGGGSIGGTLIEYLLKAGAEVFFSEENKDIIRHFRDEVGLQYIPAKDIYTTECDIFAPCALGGGLNAKTIPKLKCRVVAGGANNQLAEAEDAERLRARGILYAPDYVINVGAAMAIPEIESLGWSQKEAEKQVTDSVKCALRKIFESSKLEGITTEVAARQIAEERLTTGTWPRDILREYDCW
jgi:leucine dehydrogenase